MARQIFQAIVDLSGDPVIRQQLGETGACAVVVATLSELGVARGLEPLAEMVSE
jgi:hypothetical protein